MSVHSLTAPRNQPVSQKCPNVWTKSNTLSQNRELSKRLDKLNRHKINSALLLSALACFPTRVHPPKEPMRRTKFGCLAVGGGQRLHGIPSQNRIPYYIPHHIIVITNTTIIVIASTIITTIISAIITVILYSNPQARTKKSICILKMFKRLDKKPIPLNQNRELSKRLDKN